MKRLRFRFARLAASVLVACGTCGVALGEPGLDAPVAVGPFLNGVFPSTAPGQSGNWALADAFPGLTFVDPVRMVPDPRGADHVFIVCRNGEIWRIPFSAAAGPADKRRVLDLSANTLGFGDSGMMSIAFHPDFGVAASPNRGFVYVFYQYSPDPPAGQDPATQGYLRLSRFTIQDDTEEMDPASERVMIQQFDRHSWHTGGGMFFGVDRLLYLAIGDEGGSNDFYDSGQKINDRLFGGILRIDVDSDPARSHPPRRQPKQLAMPEGWPKSFTSGYGIPNDNPWQDRKGGILEEFWTIGTRNPHSMCLDDESGEIFVADVGQDQREEITIARRGGNHQWPFKEGSIKGPKPKPKRLIGKEVPPVYDYGRAMGGCVIGGMVYRGSVHAGALTGKYLFGDHSSRGLYALERPDDEPVAAEFLTSVPRAGGEKRGLAGISEGPDGEPYFIELGDSGTNTGKIYKLIRSGPPVAEPPKLLSRTGAFADLATLTPSPGLVPYDVISPLWTDGAAKLRWIALPNDGSHDTPQEQVRYRDRGEWEFPVGTVLVKHFALAMDERKPDAIKPVETRFFVHGEDGIYYGVTYRWNEAGTDAELLSKREIRKMSVTAGDGKKVAREWTFPSRADCYTCHSPDAGNVLGLRSHQLADGLDYPATGRHANQLETWNHLGMFGQSFGGRNPATVKGAVNPRNPLASMDERVKSYLDANCAHCHHPGGVAANFDASFHTPLASQGLIGGLVNRPFTGPEDRVVAPGDLVHSLMHARVSATGAKQMPPIGKNVVDRSAVELITDWIRGLDAESFPPNSEPGLQADYYAGRDFEELVESRTDPAINFNWGTGSPGEGIPEDHFSVRWHGTLIPPVSGSYTFITTSDDGIRVMLNGGKIIDNWEDQEETERSAPILLTAGRPVSIVVESYESTGIAMAGLEWTGPGIGREVVPEAVLRRSSKTDQKPVADDDTFRISRLKATDLDVLANDIGFNAPLGIHGVAISNPPAHGTIRASGAKKRLVYTPDGTGDGNDSFTYTVTDSRGVKSNEATVVIRKE